MNGGDAGWMRAALRRAVRSLGCTAPNPGVGCVVVRAGRLLGVGRHAACGDPHAEVLALADCRASGHDPAGATVHVTLAPCTAHGRTPPCVEALIAAGVARVVAGCADPGQTDPGPILTAAGITYTCGCEEDLAREVHGGFLRRIVHGRPRVTGKWAMTLDGFLACTGGDAGWISSPEALSLSRRRRRVFDAILVGAGTALADDPSLRSSVPGRSPRRIVLSPSATIADGAAGLRLWREGEPPWIVHDADAPRQRIEGLRELGSRLLPVADARDPASVAGVLGAAGINELLVEGGARLHAAWLAAGLYDRLECYLGAETLAGGLPVARGPGVPVLAAAERWRPTGPPLMLGSTVCLRYRRATGAPDG